MVGPDAARDQQSYLLTSVAVRAVIAPMTGHGRPAVALQHE